MPARTRSILTAGLLTTLAACAVAQDGRQPGEQAAEPQAANAAPVIDSADALLDALETADAGLRTLTATIRYTRIFALAGDRQVRTGELAFATDDRDMDGDAERMFSIRFSQLIVGDRVENETKDYIFDGSWLVERLPEEKLFAKRQVAPPGSDVDPLRIGEGPLPIPIGQKKSDILERFDAEMVDPADGLRSPALVDFVSAGPGTYQLRLVPKPEAADAVEFTEVRLWYKRDSLLPWLAVTQDIDGDESFVQLVDLKINNDAPVAPQLFSVEPPADAEGWDVRIEPWRGNAENDQNPEGAQ